MSVHKVIVCFVLIVFASTIIRGAGQNVTDSSCADYATKLQYLQQKLIEMEYAMQKDRKTIDEKLSHQETQSEVLLAAIAQLSETISYNLTSQQIQSNTAEQTAKAKHEQLWKEIQMLASKEDLAWFKTKTELYLRSISHRSCMEVSSQRTGKYFIQPTADSEPFLGFCGQTAMGGGWLVVQLRYDGLLDFRRNWTEYRNGFGSVDGELWLGLEHLHRVTSVQQHELMVELEDFSGNFKWARFNAFEIGSEVEQYPIKKLGSHTGTAADVLNLRTGMKFSTKDRQISTNSSCASHFKAAWWFSDCFHSNLNGALEDDDDENSFQYTRMLIRKT